MRGLAFFILFTLFLQASYVKWDWEYEKALLKAKEQNKHLLLFVTKKSCESCKEVFTTLFQNNNSTGIINKNFISVVAFFEEENSYPLELFYTQTFPALFFISNHDESNLISPLFGDIKLHELEKSLKKTTTQP